MKIRALSIVALGLISCADGAGGPIVSFENDGLVVYNAFAPASPAPDLATVFFSLVNKQNVPDSIVDVVLADSGARAEMHHVQGGMQQVTSIPVAAGGRVDLEPGGFHIMLFDLLAPLVSGDTIDITLRFSSAPDAVVRVGVLNYTEVVQNLGRGVP